MDWLSKMADWLLGAGGAVAGLFVGKDAASFAVVQMMVATLVLAAIVLLIVYWQSVVDYIAGRRQNRKE